MSSQSNKSNLRQSLLESTLTSSKAALSRRWQGWIRTDRWAIGAQRSSTYIAVALLFTFFIDCCFNHMAAWKVLPSFIDEVCTKLDFARLDWRPVTEESQLTAWARARKQIKLFIFCFFDFLFGHIRNILLTELCRSLWENLELCRWYRPHCVRCVLATSVKILPYRPPARLIRTKYKIWVIVIGPSGVQFRE